MKEKPQNSLMILFTSFNFPDQSVQSDREQIQSYLGQELINRWSQFIYFIVEMGIEGGWILGTGAYLRKTKPVSLPRMSLTVIGLQVFWLYNLSQQQSHSRLGMLDIIANLATLLGFTWLGWAKLTIRHEEERIDQARRQIDSARFYHHDLSKSKPEEIIDFQKLKEQPNKRVEVLLMVPSKNIRYHKLSILEKSRIYRKGSLMPSSLPNFLFLEERAAQNFKIDFQGKQIIVDPRQCNINSNILEQVEVDIQVFPGKKAKFSQRMISFNWACDMVLVGTLGYSLDKQQFHLIPSFILSTLLPDKFAKDNQEYLQFIKQYYLDGSQAFVTFKKGLILFSFLLIIGLRSDSVATGFQYIKRLYRRVMDWKRNRQPELEERKEIFANPDDKLKCPCGKTLNVIYDCGHLVVCITCHEQAIDKRCRICGRVTNDILRIFT